MPKSFDFFYDLGSPYSYLASTQLAGIEQRTGSRARLLAITLGGLRKATGHHLPPPQQLKYVLRKNTDLALGRGVFGVPTLFVGERSFWGNDRLQFAEAELRREQ